MSVNEISEKISEGKTFLGIELGSTRIKASLIGEDFSVFASGEHKWENRFENGLWTYSLNDIYEGLRECYADLKRDIKEKYGVIPKRFAAMGVSAMMHGYMPFDEKNTLLVPFRTWRNTVTERAAKELTELFDFNIPQRWSAAHLYQAILDKEPHVKNISYITTLAVYVHFLLTGVRKAGAGEASGMFPIKDGAYDETMLKKFGEKTGLDLKKFLPEIAFAGEECGFLTESGAKLLDPDGDLEAGISFCPPEGDAGTGMTATNSVRENTGNVSAGTSVFAMIVLGKPLSGVYPEIDVVAAPDGKPAAMVHCNSCCTEIDAWVNIFDEFSRLSGSTLDRSALYELLYKNAMKAPAGCGGVTAFGCVSGEPVIGLSGAKPMYFRETDKAFTLGEFFRAQLYSALTPLKIGTDILFEKENVNVLLMNAHGGLFKVKGAAQQILADALNVPVAVTKNAAEGGAWGMAVLAAYSRDRSGLSLADFLDEKVFAGSETVVANPDKEGRKGFLEFAERYKRVILAQKSI